MILAALLGVALQMGAAQGGVGAPILIVRDAEHSVRVPTVATVDGPMLRPDALPFPVTVHHDSASWYTLEVYGAKLQLETGTPIVRVGDDTRPLAASPIEQNGRLMIPLQLVSEVFPTVVPNTRWDPDNSQLVLFGDVMPDRPARSNGQSNGQSGVVRSPRREASRAAASDAELPPVPEKHHRRTIIVDAGHGGVDNGMTGPLGGGPRIYEKNITLAVAKKLGAQLDARGVDVVYTRTTDTLIALDDRGRIANRAHGDLFISIHVNAANPNWKDPGGSRGFETYFLSEARTEDARRVEQMENSAARFETPEATIGRDDALNFIKSDMRQNEHLRESSDLADLIQQSLAKMEPGPNRGVKQAGFRVLVTAYMPAVLVEIGFGTNPREAAFLSDPDKQEAIAAAIADGAMDYLDRYERRMSGVQAGDPRR